MILGADLNSRVQSGMRPLLVINIVSQPPASSSVSPQHGQCCCSLCMSRESTAGDGYLVSAVLCKVCLPKGLNYSCCLTCRMFKTAMKKQPG